MNETENKTSLAHDYAKRFAMVNSYHAHTQILGEMCRHATSFQQHIALRKIRFTFTDASQIAIQSDAYDRAKTIEYDNGDIENERD